MTNRTVEAAEIAKLADLIERAVGDIIAFPGQVLGQEYDIEAGDFRDGTLDEFMADTWIYDRWPALRRRAAEAAARATLSERSESE